jgi:hypothetical protein
MPYRNAHLYMIGVIGVLILGFWPSYFAVLRSSPWQFHAHGVASSLWVLTVTAQSWTAHRKAQLPLHRAVGKASLFLFPFLIGGLAAIIDVTARTYVAGEEPVHLADGGSFLAGLTVAAAAYCTLYYRALKYRRKVWLHSGYLLATPLILWESPVSRILGNYLPVFAYNGPADVWTVMATIQWASASALLICLIVRLRAGERAQPFVVAAGFIAAEMAAMAWLGDLAAVRRALTAIAGLPSAAMVATGMAIGAATSWAGWEAGKRPEVPVRGAAAAA